MIYVIGPRDKKPEGTRVVNVTSRANSPFSPFLNGCSFPIQSVNMENAWQYSKVYEEHDNNGEPNEAWYKWQAKGIASKWAARYPMGKGRFPLYSWFNGERLSYVEARKKLYDPLYRNMLQNVPDSVDKLCRLATEMDIALWDFDGYNDPDKTYEEIINDPDKKMGHAFVLREVIIERLG